MTRAVCRMSARTGARQLAAAGRAGAARRARSRRRASSRVSHGCAIVRGGSRSRCSSRWPSTWRSVSATKPRLARSPEQRRERADGEGAGIPQRVEQARARAELLQARLAPGQMIGLLARGVEQQLAGCGGAGDEGLAVIERLGGDLAGMIDAHERGGRARRSASGRAACSASRRRPGRGAARRPCAGREQRPAGHDRRRRWHAVRVGRPGSHICGRCDYRRPLAVTAGLGCPGGGPCGAPGACLCIGRTCLSTLPRLFSAPLCGRLERATATSDL